MFDPGVLVIFIFSCLISLGVSWENYRDKKRILADCEFNIWETNISFSSEEPIPDWDVDWAEAMQQGVPLADPMEVLQDKGSSLNQDLNQDLNLGVNPEAKPNLNKLNLGTFDPMIEEQPGEFEIYQALLKMHGWSPRSKQILKALWGANPNAKKYPSAVERRNLFADRLESPTKENDNDLHSSRPAE